MLVGRVVLDGHGAAGGSWDYYLLAVLSVLAMGWQNAALRRVAGAFRRARLHGGVWASYLGGGVLGAFLALHWDLWSLILPLAVLGVLVAIDVARRA